MQRRWFALNNSSVFRNTVLVVSWAYLAFSFVEADASAGSQQYHVAVALNYIGSLTLLFYSASSVYWRYRLDGRLIMRFVCQVCLCALVSPLDKCACGLGWVSAYAVRRLPLFVLWSPFLCVCV
jgi:hypothetical protein